MGEIMTFNTERAHGSFADGEIRLISICDVVVSLIMAIEEGKTFSMAKIKEQMIEVLEIIQEEL